MPTTKTETTSHASVYGTSTTDLTIRLERRVVPVDGRGRQWRNTAHEPVFDVGDLTIRDLRALQDEIANFFEYAAEAALRAGIVK